MSKKTVYVIGAGASAEFELPTGNDLKTMISSFLTIEQDDIGRISNVDKILYPAMELHAREKGEPLGRYIQDANLISKALPLAISIDHFIHAHREKEEIAFCGKLAIARSILQAEKRSLLYIDTNRSEINMNFNKVAKTWLTPFFQLITENCNINELKERFQSLKFIIFNYDRCVEHYLFFALQNYYRITKEEAKELIEEITFFHPYGSIGFLPWSRKNNTVQFGLSPSPKQLLEISTMIKTFTEGTDPDSSEIKQMRYQVKISDRIIFLGFAFHPLNMQIITPDFNDLVDLALFENPPKCYSTYFGISESDKLIITSDLKKMFDGHTIVKMVNTKCYKFFDEFKRSLSFT